MYKYLDNWIAGIVLGLILPPLVGVLGLYIYLNQTLTTMEVDLASILKMNELFDNILQLSCLVNLIPFFAFYYMRYDVASKGVIASTFIFIIIVAILNNI